MKCYTVRNAGVTLGTVEAPTAQAAVEAAYKQFSFGEREAPTLHREQLAMHVLFDITNARPIARHDSHRALAALAYIQFANVDTVIIRAGENRSYTIFSAEQLNSIALALGLNLAANMPYNERIKATRHALETKDFLLLPYTTEQLERQAFAIKPSESKPLRFDPDGDVPKSSPKWSFDPQTNRKREDSSHAHEFAAGLGYGVGVAPPPPATATDDAPRRPSASPAPRPKASSTPAAPKAPRAPAAPSARPKGGSTGKVWDIADSLKGKHGDDHKALRKAVVEACAAEGINSSTASVQFGKWKASQ